MNDRRFWFECSPAMKVFDNNKIKYWVQLSDRRILVNNEYYYHPIKYTWRHKDSWDWHGPDSPKKFLQKVGLCK